LECLPVDSGAVEWIQIIVLSLIQGITEFLPISSSAHLILPAMLTDWPDQGLAFDIAVHLGSLIAVVLYFRHELAQFAVSGSRMVIRGQYDAHTELMLKVITATLPVLVAGFLLQGWVETELRSIVVIATTTSGFALALMWADKLRGNIDEPSWLHAMVIGAAQVLAIVPGTSRSGITITAALVLGLSRTSAARFSFLLSMPTIAGAAFLTILDLRAAGAAARWPELAMGAALAGVSAYACIHYFITLVERTGMMPYVFYRLALAATLLAIANWPLLI
jgi:undecaprenyl-diphosphatase